VDRDDVARLQQGLLRGRPLHPGGGGAGVVEIRAPGDHPHAEGAPDLGHPSPDLPEAEDAEGRTREVGADCALPGAACPQGQALRRHVTGQSEDQRPGQLRRRRRARIRAADDDVARPGRREVDGEVAHAAGHEQLEPGQPLQQRRRERRPLPHDHEDLGLRDPRHEIVGIRDVLGDRGDGDAIGEARPVRERESRLLVIVEDQAGAHERGLGLGGRCVNGRRATTRGALFLCAGQSRERCRHAGGAGILDTGEVPGRQVARAARAGALHPGRDLGTGPGGRRGGGQIAVLQRLHGWDQGVEQGAVAGL
jgi:hypothetical protein